MTLSYDYWKDREEKARQQTIKDEEERIKEIEEIYKRMFDEIQRDIDSFFAKYAADEGISIAEAKKRVSKLDMEEFERKAKEYVKNKDFSDQANEEMKLYNLTMKVNRLEMLKAKIGLELVNGYQEIEDYMGEALTETTMKEIERHAGILGKTVGDNQDYAEDIVDASFHNATWSERIWANQDRLKHDLGKLLTSGLIQGKNPRELARDLQKSMNVSKYDAERLMRTEMCRVQIDASLREIEANGFTQFIFIADSGGSRTCEQCKALDGKTFALKDGKIGVNLPPLHPNCRCSIAGHEDDEDFIDWLENHGVELTDDDLKAMGLSRDGNSKDAEQSRINDVYTDKSTGTDFNNLRYRSNPLQEPHKMRFRLDFQFFSDRYAEEKREFQSKVLQGLVRLKTRIQKQDKHIYGTKRFIEEIEKARQLGQSLPSYFPNISSSDIERMFSSYYGHGKMDRKNDGSMREFVTVPGIEAYYYEAREQRYKPTNRFMIKYSKYGVHVIPVEPYNED